MKKKLLTYITGDILVKGLSFLMLPIFSHLILPSEYGVLGLLSAIVAFMPTVLTLSYMNGFVRFSIETNEKTLISTFIFLGIILNIIYFVIALLLYKLVIYSYEISFNYYLLSIITSVIVFIFHILMVYFQSISDAKSYMKMSVLYGLLGIFLNFIFVTYMEDNILAMLLANFMNTLVFTLASLIIIYPKFFWDSISFSLGKEVLIYTAPLTLGAIGLLVFSQMDKLVLVEYINKTELGIYTVALSVSLAISYLGKALFMSYQPIFLQSANKNDNLILKRYKGIVIFILASMFLTFFAIVIIYEVINPKYYSGIHVALVNTMAYTFIVFTRILELQLSYKKKSNIIALVYILGGILTVILLYLLIPIYGMIGASYSLYISGFIISILMYFSAQRYFFLSYSLLVTLCFYVSIFLTFVIINSFIIY